MKLTGLPSVLRNLVFVAACLALAATLSACASEGHDATSDKLLALEAKLHSLKESLEAVQEENVSLQSELAALLEENAVQKSELAVLRQEQADYIQAQEAQAQEAQAQEAAESAQDHEEEVAELEEGQEKQLAALEEGQARDDRRFDDLDLRLQELEEVAMQLELVLPAIEKWFTGMDERVKLLEGTGIERTLRLVVAEGGGQAQVINYGAAYGGARSAVLVLPDPLPEGEIPLIVSLHGFGSDSFFQGQYVTFHDRVNRDGFALLLPNGVENAEGQRFWNPTDGFGKARQDDVGALTALVQEAGGEFDMGPVYFFGYSNGGFMSYWMACQGLPGLRAVASLAGTSYMDAAACESAPPVSVLHIHGEQDRVVRFHGSEESQLPALKPGERYAGAKDMHYRWAERAGCDANSQKQGENLDLDAAIEGEETFTYRFTEGCAEGITVELWSSDEGGHTPVYGDAFADALLDWLLAQE